MKKSMLFILSLTAAFILLNGCKGGDKCGSCPKWSNAKIQNCSNQNT